MRADRYVLLGLAPARQSWFTTVAHWSHTGTIAADFLKCQSAEEVRARLASEQVFSALLVDMVSSGLDRDLVDLARRSGCAVLLVGEARGRLDWRQLGADALLDPALERADLLEALARHAVTVGDPTLVSASTRRESGACAGSGTVVAVCGPGGTGASTVAAALAQGLARAGDRRVLLADLCLHAEQAMLHDAGDLGPSVQELVEAHRIATITTDDARRLAHTVPSRGYDLLVGLRRSRGWAALRPRAFEASFQTLRATWDIVVADTDADVEGEADGGSADVEERNVMARTALGEAQAVVVVGASGLKGLHALLRTAAELIAFGVAPARIVPVVNRLGRGRRHTVHPLRALADLLPSAITTPAIGISERRVESAFIDGTMLPDAVVDPVLAAVGPLLASPHGQREPTSVAVSVGTLGRWSPDDVGATAS
ncbi:MAG TPA: hypothetical protein VM030_08835 [Acidimicrobiales bacterium]|nr:hypothetical protein [Acidimicrobiales bacterium]